MKGIIINFHIAYTKEILVKVKGIANRKSASKLIGRKAVWLDPQGNKWVGKVTGVHGTGGTIKVRFKKSLPPICLAKPIEIEDG